MESTLVFGVVEIAGKRCSGRGRDGEPVAVMPYRTREEGANVVWYCANHAKEMRAVHAEVPLFEVSPTCGFGGESPCGAAATHVAVVGIPGKPPGANLGIVSVCARHLREGQS